MNVKYLIIFLFIIFLGFIIFFIYKYCKKREYLLYINNLDFNKYNINDILLPQYKNIVNKKVKTIPKKIFQTYKNKKNIPKIVFDNIDKYAKSYEYNFYNDEDCEGFLKKYFIPEIFKKFKSMKKGAHKADLFRYCVLYLYGGIYIDIKTELIKPIENIFNKNYNFYTVLSTNSGSIYQGVIASFPFNDIFKRSINFILETKNNKIDENYSIFVDFLYRDLENNTKNNKLNRGENILKNNDKIYLFKELCCTTECKNKPKDRYGLYCTIQDKNDFIIKTRFESFPW